MFDDLLFIKMVVIRVAYHFKLNINVIDILEIEVELI